MRGNSSRAVHYLREPVRAIRAASELLIAAREERSGEVENRCAGLIQSGLDRIQTLVRDIAEYCAGEIREFDPQDTDLAEALKEAQRQLTTPLADTKAVVTTDDLPAVRADFEALASVFRDLLDNACKFRQDAPPQIHIRAQNGINEWMVAVSDRGRGFDPRYKDLIFQPFERLEGRLFPGSGLGLARAKRAVEQHGGRIWAESAPGEGATIWFTLPDLTLP